MAANPFDQFDATSAAPASNPFDKFDGEFGNVEAGSSTTPVGMRAAFAAQHGADVPMPSSLEPQGDTQNAPTLRSLNAGNSGPDFGPLSNFLNNTGVADDVRNAPGVIASNVGTFAHQVVRDVPLLVGGAGAKVADTIAGAATGEPVTAAEDYVFRNAVDPFQHNIDVIQSMKPKAQGFVGQTVDKVSGMAGPLALGVAAPELEGVNLLSVPEVGLGAAMRGVGNTIKANLPTATAIATPGAIESGKAAAERGGNPFDVFDATVSDLASGTVQNMLPMAQGGQLATRAATGAGLNTALGAANRAVSGQDTNASDVVSDAIIGAGLGAMHTEPGAAHDNKMPGVDATAVANDAAAKAAQPPEAPTPGAGEPPPGAAPQPTMTPDQLRTLATQVASSKGDQLAKMADTLGIKLTPEDNDNGNQGTALKQPAASGDTVDNSRPLGADESGVPVDRRAASAQAGPGDAAGANGVERGEVQGRAVAKPEIPEFAGLTPEQREVEARARAQVLKDPEKALSDYEALPTTDGGRIINTDEAREIFPDYNAGPEARSANAAAVHEPSSWVAKEEWKRQLAKPPSSDDAFVLITGGGTGAGKSSGMSRDPGLAKLQDHADVVFDNNLKDEGSAAQKIDQALASGRNAQIVFTFRDPLQALVHGALPRAESKGRTVPIPIHVDTHIGAAKTFLALKKRYADDPRVTIRAIVNDYDPRAGRSDVRRATDEDAARIAGMNRDTLHTEARNALETEHKAGAISDRVYHGTLGTPAPGAGSVRRSPGASGQRPRVPERNSAPALDAEAERARLNATPVTPDNRASEVSARAQPGESNERRTESGTGAAQAAAGREDRGTGNDAERVASGNRTATAEAGAGGEPDRVTPEALATQAGANVMQNRDRTRAASVAQMSSIANTPDASRLSFSRDANTGAPMVSAQNAEHAIPESDMGRRDHVTMADGEKIPVRYAVVDASDVQASHNADGSTNHDYANGKLKALNNGRVAGLKAAYAKGEPGEAYKVGLHDETELTGVSSKAIASKKNPVLIRLYDAQHNKGDMGSRSNAEQALGQSATEKAYADARAPPDLAGLPITDAGDLSTNPNNPFYRSFLRNLGTNEAAKLVDSKGEPNKQFFDRVRAAVFAKAYGNERMLTAMAEDADPDARNVLNALVKAAPEWAQVDKTGPFGDYSKRIAAAFDILRAAREAGQPVREYMKQGDLIKRDRSGDLWAEFFGQHARSANKIADGLREAARLVKDEQAQAGQDQMFARPPLSAEDVTEQSTGLSDEHSQRTQKAESGRVAGNADATVRQGNDQARGRGGQSESKRGTAAGKPVRTEPGSPDESGPQLNALRPEAELGTGLSVDQLRKTLLADRRIGNSLRILEDNGALDLVSKPGDRFAGRFQNGRLILNAAYLPHDDALGTALHEVVHRELRAAGGLRAFTGPGEFDRLQRRLDELKALGGDNAALVADAEARAAQSGETGNRLAEERLAYFTAAARDAQSAGKTLPARAANILRQITAAIRAAIYNSKLGKWLESKGRGLKLTPDDFVALAEKATHRQAMEARDARDESGKPFATNALASRPRDTATTDMFGAPQRSEREQAPRPQTGDLFGGASARDHVDAAERASDAQRNGLAGGRDNSGAGGLFDGKRPDQTDIERPLSSLPRERALGEGEAPRPAERGRLAAVLPESIRKPLGDILDEVQKGVTPMASGSDAARAAAKDFANESRLAVHQYVETDKFLQKNFTREQQERMWRAADEQSVLMQRGEDTKGKGLDRLAPDERAAVDLLQRHADAVFEKAQALGMVEGEGLPSYVPRMVVEMGASGARRVGANANKPGPSGVGANLKTSAGALKQRKHETIEETIAAAKAKFGDDADVVSNIRTLPLATRQLSEAIAGRSLMNQVKELGRAAGRDNVREGSAPANEKDQWFTVDHPAFKTWRPRFDEHGDIVKGEDGEPVFDKIPLYVHKDFEGPLKAVLSPGKDGAFYSALMAAKAKSMSLIMYSPIIHNAVEWGRALPAMPGRVFTFRVYFDGNKAKNDPATMREAISAGLAPIGGHGAMNDITGIADDRQIEPGRSLTAKGVGALVDRLLSKDSGNKARAAIDKMGDVWHNTLLWDRVGDLQMGLYTNLRDSMVRKGIDTLSAQRIAAHMANRYAGALPKEAMSTAARKIANLALFSRSFTFGNLGAMKDALTGMPKDVQAQIMRDSGQLMRDKAVSVGRRKSVATLVLDIGLMYLTNSILQSSIAMVSGRSDLSQEEEGYARRMGELMARAKEHPLDVLNIFKDLNTLTPQGENEPGKQDRVLAGHMADGTAIYMRNPAGKIGEEFQGWMTEPLDMIKRKLGTFARPAYQTITNDIGFGRHLYDPNAEGISGAAENVGKIVMNFLGDQVPLQALTAAKDYLAGHGDPSYNAAQVVGPLAGFTFSKGAPGGPAVGEMYAARDRHDYAVQQAMPDIRKMIQAGDVDGAREKMHELGVPPGKQRYYIRTTQNPESRLSASQLKQFGKYADQEELDAMARFRAQQEGDQAASGQ